MQQWPQLRHIHNLLLSVNTASLCRPEGEAPRLERVAEGRTEKMVEKGKGTQTNRKVHLWWRIKKSWERDQKNFPLKTLRKDNHFSIFRQRDVPAQTRVSQVSYRNDALPSLTPCLCYQTQVHVPKAPLKHDRLDRKRFTAGQTRRQVVHALRTPTSQSLSAKPFYRGAWAVANFVESDPLFLQLSR